MLLAPVTLAGCSSGSPSEGGWTQRAELQGNDTQPHDLFGTTVGLSGSTLVVGAPGHGGQTGAAYLFHDSGGSWSQTGEVEGGDTVSFDQFGSAVAVDGSTMVAGAPLSHNQQGRAYVFAETRSGWHQVAELVGSDTKDYDGFGSSVAVSGGTVVVGAAEHDYRAGAAYVFERTPSGWHQVAKLVSSNEKPYDAFGSSVAVSGGTIVIGAEYVGDNDGAAYVFRERGTQWHQVAELTASDRRANDFYGSAVAVSGDLVAVGAYDHGKGAGRAYLYTETGGRWHQIAELVGSDTVAGDYFGSAVAVSGDLVGVAAQFDAGGAGRVYLFERRGSTFSEVAEIRGGDTAGGDAFGTGLALSGTSLAVGAPDHSTRSGEVYLFARS